MAQIIIDIPDDKVAEIRDAIAQEYNYQQHKLQNETKAAFAKRMLANHVKTIYQNQTANQAAETARTSSIAATNSVAIS